MNNTEDSNFEEPVFSGNKKSKSSILYDWLIDHCGNLSERQALFLLIVVFFLIMFFVPMFFKNVANTVIKDERQKEYRPDTEYQGKALPDHYE